MVFGDLHPVKSVREGAKNSGRVNVRSAGFLCISVHKGSQKRLFKYVTAAFRFTSAAGGVTGQTWKELPHLQQQLHSDAFAIWMQVHAR